MNKNNEPELAPIDIIMLGGDYKVDSAMLEPYRLENGGIGWRAIPVEPEPEPTIIDCEDCDGQGDYEVMTPRPHGETDYHVFTCDTCDGAGVLEVDDE